MEIDVKIKKNNGEIVTVKYSPHEKQGRTLPNYIKQLIKEDVKRSKGVDVMDFIIK